MGYTYRAFKMSIILNHQIAEVSWSSQLDSSSIPQLNHLKNGLSFLLPTGKEMNLKPINDDIDQSGDISTEVFTRSEAFIKNSIKIEFLKQGVYNVDPIIFWFSPEFGLNLAASQLVGKLSGITDQRHINHILSKNQGIFDFLLPFYKINLSVYQYSLMKITGIPQDLTKVILMALTEVLMLQLHEQFNHPYLSLDQLIKIGLYQRLNDESYQQNSKELLKMDRDSLNETNHVTMHFLCFECMVLFETSDMLLIHIKSHGPNYGCGQCGLKFEDYTQKIAHSMTFCRYPKHKLCFYCQQDKSNCICHKNFLTMSALIRQTLKDEDMEEMKSKNLFSSWFQHYFDNSLHRNDKKVMISTGPGVTEDTVIDSILPIIKFSSENISWYDEYVVSISDVKENLESRFSDYRQIIMEMDNFIKLFSMNCWVQGCEEKNDENHLKAKHLLCPFSIEMHRNEAPEFVSRERFLQHFYNHCQSSIPDFLQCTLCSQKFTKTDQLFNIIMEHKLGSHKEQPIGTICTQDQCSNVQCSDEKSFILHCLAWHKNGLKTICEMLSVTVGSQNPEKKPIIASGGSKFETPTRLIKHPNKNLLDSLKNINDNKSPIKAAKLNDNLIELGITSVKMDLGDNNKICSPNIHGITLEEAMSGSKDSSSIKIGDMFPDKNKAVCRNEQHSPPKVFESEETKQLHIMTSHTCPACKFFAEFDKDIISHFNATHRAAMTKCQLCAAEVLNMKEHLQSAHFKCPSCKKFFNTSYDLTQHTVFCNSTDVEDYEEEHSSIQSLNKDMKKVHLEDRKSELDFNAFMIKLISNSNLGEDEKEMGKNIIQKRASQQIIARERARNNLFASEHTTHLIFEIPKFKESSSKEAVTKASALIGNIKEEDIFYANPKESIRECLINYEKLEMITKKIERVSILTALSEGQSKIFLQGFLHYNVTDSLSAFAQKEFLDLTYVQILTYLQYMYVPIDFSRLEIKVMNYKKEAGENFIEFSSRCYRHLNLTSKKLPEERRTAYVEQQLRRLLKSNLSDKIYKEVIEREAIDQEFTSKELLNYYLNTIQTQGRLQNMAEVYDVNSVIPSVRPLVRNSNSEDKEKSKSKSYNSLLNSKRPKSFTPSEKKKVKSVETKPYQKVPSSKPILSPKMREYIKERKEKLGIKGDIEDVWCLKCKQKDSHFSRDCPTYLGPAGTTICYQYENNRKTPCGFHDPSVCVKKLASKNTQKQAIWGPKTNSKRS